MKQCLPAICLLVGNSRNKNTILWIFKAVKQNNPAERKIWQVKERPVWKSQTLCSNFFHRLIVLWLLSTLFWSWLKRNGNIMYVYCTCIQLEHRPNRENEQHVATDLLSLPNFRELNTLKKKREMIFSIKAVIPHGWLAMHKFPSVTDLKLCWPAFDIWTAHIFLLLHQTHLRHWHNKDTK